MPWMSIQLLLPALKSDIQQQQRQQQPQQQQLLQSENLWVKDLEIKIIFIVDCSFQRF